MKTNKNNFGNSTYIETGLLDKSDISPFHAGMRPKIVVRVAKEELDNPSSDESEAMNVVEQQVFDDIIKRISENRKPITREEISNNPHGFGTIKDGKYVSFIDEFNQQKGIMTDRKFGNSLQKNKKVAPIQADTSPAFVNLGNKGVI